MSWFCSSGKIQRETLNPSEFENPLWLPGNDSILLVMSGNNTLFRNKNEILVYRGQRCKEIWFS